MPLRRIRLLIADDHAPFAASLQELLSQEDAVEVVGIARNGLEAVSLTAALEPDVILLDVNMPLLDGFQAAERIRDRNPSTRIVILTGDDSPASNTRARDIGTFAYVLKTNASSQLMGAIRPGSPA